MGKHWNNLTYFFLRVKKSIFDRLHQFFYFKKLIEVRDKVLSSIWLFSAVVLWGSFSLAIVRWVQMWAFNAWEYLNFYYFTVGLSFLISFVAIAVRYFTLKGYLDRSSANDKKWSEYINLVSNKYDIAVAFKLNSLCKLLFVVLFLLDTVFMKKGVMVLFPPVLFVWSITAMIIGYCVWKTPVPDDLLLEPPEYFKRFCERPFVNKILVRRYSSRAGKKSFLFYTDKSRLKKIALGTAAVVGTVVSADQGLASYTGDTAYGTRILDYYKEGYTTPDRKARDRLKMLQEFGFEKSDFIGSDGRLKTREIHKAYNEWRSSFESVSADDYKHLKSLEERVELQQAEMRAQQAEIDRLKQLVSEKEGGIK